MALFRIVLLALLFKTMTKQCQNNATIVLTLFGIGSAKKCQNKAENLQCFAKQTMPGQCSLVFSLFRCYFAVVLTLFFANKMLPGLRRRRTTPPSGGKRHQFSKHPIFTRARGAPGTIGEGTRTPPGANESACRKRQPSQGFASWWPLATDLT